MIPTQANQPEEGWGIGVRNPVRLQRVVEAELTGHLGDADLDAVVNTLQLATRAPVAVVNIVSHNLQTYPAEVGLGVPSTTIPDDLSFCAEVVESGRPLVVADARAHPVFAANPLVEQRRIGAYAGVPLVHRDVVLGTVAVFEPEPREFSPEALEILAHLSKLTTSVLALRTSARTDPLTGLPNHIGFSESLRRALARLERRVEMVCTMYLDVDDFKLINDHYGHDVGDHVLVEFGRRLQRVLRPSDTLARIGGDEFAIVCEDIASIRAAHLLIERMHEVLEPPWSAGGFTFSVTASIGSATTISPTTPGESLMRQADRAMYAAKAHQHPAPGGSPARSTPPTDKLRFLNP